MPITTIPTIPPPPIMGEDNPEQFEAKASAFLGSLPNLRDALNVFGLQATSLEANVTALEANVANSKNAAASSAANAANSANNASESKSGATISATEAQEAKVAAIAAKATAEQKALEATNAALAAFGRGGPLNAADFGTATPTQEELTKYACEDVFGAGGVFEWDDEDPAKSSYTIGGEAHTVGEIFNRTSVRNTFEMLNHRWELVNTPDTDPPCFSWSNTGVDLINIATFTQPGVVKPDGKTIGVNPLTGELYALESPEVIYISGSGNWIAPKSGTLTAILIGGGGSGGSSATALYSSNGGNGGANQSVSIRVEAGNSYPYSIGAGGAGVSNRSGYTGGATTFAGYSVNGGSGGAQAVAGTSTYVSSGDYYATTYSPKPATAGYMGYGNGSAGTKNKAWSGAGGNGALIIHGF
jgi:hypothetical protein